MANHKQKWRPRGFQLEGNDLANWNRLDQFISNSIMHRSAFENLHANRRLFCVKHSDEYLIRYNQPIPITLDLVSPILDPILQLFASQ